MTTAEAAQLAGIFAKVTCANVLAMEAGWAWPEHDWKRLVQSAKRDLQESETA